MSTKVQKVYADGELVYDITGEPVTPPDPPDPLPEGSITFAFAEIPEQVFVSGYADTEDMNLYHLDVLNLYPTGTMRWYSGNSFSPRLKCDLVGTLPTGVTWNRDTGFLTYDGTEIADNYTGVLHFYQAAADATSETFEIKLFKPTLEWSFNSTGVALHDAVNTALASNTEAENVVVILPGEYLGTDLRVQSDGYLACFGGRDNIYIIGSPAGIGEAMPMLSGDKNDDWVLEYEDDITAYGNMVKIRCENTPHVHLKGLEIRLGQITTTSADPLKGRLDYVSANKIKFHTNPYGVEGWGYGKIYEINNDKPKVFVNNFEVYHAGANGVRHAIYGELVSSISTQDPWKQGYVYLNNLWSYETKGPGQIYGGIGYKDFTNNVFIRNSKISKTKTDDLTQDNVDKSSPSELISFAAHQKSVMFNVDIISFTNGSSQILTYASRKLQVSLGAIQPPYFSWPNLVGGSATEDNKVGYDAWENFEGEDTLNPEGTLQPWYASKDQTFHGDNWDENYSATGEKDDVTPNPLRAPVPAPFWDTIGDPSNPLNDELTFQKYMSHCRYVFLYNTTTTFNEENLLTETKAISHRTSAPNVAEKQFGSACKLPVPPNWTERSYLFTCNNSFTGFNIASNQLIYELAYNSSIHISYPYAPDWSTVMLDRITTLGGDVIEGVGENMAIPVWFKI